MTSAKRPGAPAEGERRVVSYPPDEALRRAKPLPADEELVIEGVSEQEWELFRQTIKS